MHLSNFLSFEQLKSRGVVNNRTQLSRLIGKCNFRRGFFFRRMHVAGRKRKSRNGLKRGVLVMIRKQPDGCHRSPA